MSIKLATKPGISFQSLYLTATDTLSSPIAMNMNYHRTSQMHNISSIITNASTTTNAASSSSSQPWSSISSPLLTPPSPHPTRRKQALSLASPTGLLSPHSSRSHNVRGASEIVPRIFISDLSFAENAHSLSSHRITHILSVLPDTIFSPPESLLCPQPKRLQVKIEDFPFAELAGHLPGTTEWIRGALHSHAENRVLVHCAEGISRSVSVVAAFLMAQYGWSPVDAVGYIKSKRRIADPNFGFVQQLHEYGFKVLGQQQQTTTSNSNSNSNSSTMMNGQPGKTSSSGSSNGMVIGTGGAVVNLGSHANTLMSLAHDVTGSLPTPPLSPPLPSAALSPSHPSSTSSSMTF